jgi:hypothetical protein
MKNSLTILFILLTVMVAAQPEITQSNMPQLGDHVVIAICSNSLDPGEPGAGQTWDMSSLIESEEQFFDYVLPSEGILADSFPNANLCAVSWLNDYSYYNVSSDALTVEGHVVTIDPSDTSVMVYNNTEQILTLPYTYNSTFSDNFEGTLSVTGFSGLTFDGSLDFEADGYGTLILPGETYQNVVRYHFYREQVNYLNGFPALTQTKEQWAWVSSDYRFWLLLMEENFDGFATNTLIWYDKNPYPSSTGYSSNLSVANLIFPNPLKAGQNLKINWDRNEAAEVSVCHLDGRLAYYEKMNLVNGSNNSRCAELRPGTYVLKINTAQSIVTQKIMIF